MPQPRFAHGGKDGWRLLAILAGLGGLAIIAGIGWIIVAGVRLFGEANGGSEQAAALQAIAAGVSLLATVVLLAVTAWYAVLTRGLLRQSGPIVSVTLGVGWLPQSGIANAVITAPLSTLVTGPPDKRFSGATWAVEVRNSGNSATKVTGIAIEAKNGPTLRPMETVGGTNPPFDLDAHSGETICLALDMVLEGVNAWNKVVGGARSDLRAVVTLGSGLTVRSRWATMPRKP